MSERLTIPDLVKALEKFGQRYEAVDVFADDIEELEELKNNSEHPALSPLDQEGRQFVAGSGGERYKLTINESGVARFERYQGPLSGTMSGSIIGGALGAAIAAATNTKGDAWAAGLLGLLVGAGIGATVGVASSPPRGAPRWVFTLSFDPRTRQWRAYDGGLTPWVKEQLLPYQ